MRNGSVRLNLTIDKDVVPLLDEMAGSVRKRGEFLSMLIQETYSSRNNRPTNELTLMAMSSRLQALEAEVLHLRQQIAAIIVRVEQK